MGVCAGSAIITDIKDTFLTFEHFQYEKAINKGKEVALANRYLAAIAELKGKITQSLAQGNKVISLDNENPLTTKISEIAKQLGRSVTLLTGSLSAESARDQMSLLDEEVQYGSQQANLLLTEITQCQKDLHETYKISSDMIKQMLELIRTILRNIRG